jgi:hypothetical protein
MEKAYAKLIGSYQAMEGGIESDALVDLTGGAQKMLALRESRGTEGGRENVWKLLRKFNERDNLMGCASNGEVILTSSSPDTHHPHLTLT